MFFKYHTLCLMARNIFYRSNLNLATLATSESRGLAIPFNGTIRPTIIDKS